ncbi:unnamed protein product [Ambrosiozyma monospora]|uniref:Unnamed protein product n=1 Tax=Ambrosiozyma monospora TaxID=43982 RepID=A0A9W7DF06_AMBMO|nr:unnamed protein product [Ambrosiozyma monospora]
MSETLPKNDPENVKAAKNSTQKKAPKNPKTQKAPKVPNNVPKKDHYQRLTYLYKIGNIMSSKLVNSGSISQTTKQGTNTFDILSRAYIKNLDLVSKKVVLKLHPNIKRTICKNCSRLVVTSPNSTMRIVNESKKKLPKNDVLEIVCECGTKKRFPFGKDPSYIPFAERDSVAVDANL